jgi:hypothetical protein
MGRLCASTTLRPAIGCPLLKEARQKETAGGREEAAARRRAEAERQELTAENEKLRRELDALRRRSAKQP